jgi:peptide/nickel transport system substrate-binding protein
VAAVPALLGPAPALADKRSNTIRFANNQAPESIDPFFNNVRIGVIIGQHVWDTLVYRDPNTGEYRASSRPPGGRLTTRRSSSTCAGA